jgi:2'-5' RNA ligase
MFFALWPDPGWSERLLGAARGPMSQGDGRAVVSADLHVTLCFLGAVGEPVLAGLREGVAALRAAQFELEFDALEYWPQSRIFAATSSRLPAAASELARTLRSLARALGLRADQQPLRPHVTLVHGMASRAEPPAPMPALSLSPPLRLAAQRFYLAQSHELEAASATAAQAHRYLRLESWPLLAPQR